MTRTSHSFRPRTVCIGAMLAALAGCALHDGDGPARSRESSRSVSSAAVSTNLATYALGANVIVNYTAMGGSATDWIAVAAIGSPPSTVAAWAYTGGGASGTLTFRDIGPGDYEARAFYDWAGTSSYTIQQTSAPFTVGAGSGTVSTSAASYTSGTPITVNYTGLPGTATDWISIAEPGSPNRSTVLARFTSGTAAGSLVFDSTLPPGTYVARTFAQDSYARVAESAPFAVTAAVSGANITVPEVLMESTSFTAAFANFPGSPTDWIAIAPAGSSATTVTDWKYTGGGSSGALAFSGLAPGNYEARAYWNWIGTQSYTVRATTPFIVAAPLSGTTFRITGLLENGCSAPAELDPFAGDDRGGIAIGLGGVYVTGDEYTSLSTTALTSHVRVGPQPVKSYDALASDLRTTTAYAFGNASGPLRGWPGAYSITHVYPLTASGSPGIGVPLSAPIAITADYDNTGASGVFSGWGYTIVKTGSALFRVALPSGEVTPMGSIALSTAPMPTENWAVWGTSEYYGGQYYIDYAAAPYVVNRIVRVRVADGATTTLATFSGGLSDLASFTFAPLLNRWYWHYEFIGQFGGTDESIGYCPATWDQP